MTRSGSSAPQCAGRLLVSVLMLAGLLVGLGSPPTPAAAQAATTYTNPLVGGLSANPFLLKSGTTYYAYVNGFDFYLPFGVMAFSSTDLVTWTQVGNVLPTGSAGTWADPATGHNFSSPSVVHVPTNPAASRYVLYFAAKRAGSAERCIGAATAATPTGPFTGRPQPLICPPGGAQDPSPLAMPPNPPFQQLVYRANGTSPAFYNQVLAADGLSVAAGYHPFLLYRPQPGWWQQGVAERPAVVVQGSDIYLFFAGGPANTAGRGIGWSRCTQGFGVLNGCSSPTHLGTFVAGTAQVQSPSGPQVLVDGTAHWLVYDGLAAGSCPATGACTGTRNLRIDKLCFAHGQPRTNGPSSGAQSRTRSTNCSADLPGAPLSVQPVTSDLALREPAKIGFRDGGAGAAVGGQLLWVFSDTLQIGPCPAPSNTAALGVPDPRATGPNWTDEPLDSGGCARQYIAHTAEETAYNTANWFCSPSPTCPKKRIALWEQGVLGHPEGYGTGFFLKLIHDADNDGEILDAQGNVISEDGNGDGYADVGCAWCYEFLGTGAVRVPARSTSADRSPAASPLACNPTCLWDSAAIGGDHYGRPFVDGDQVYLTSGGRLARAPMSQILTRSAWRYWSDAGWTATEADADPIPTVADPDNAWDEGFGDVSYNPYLDKWLNVVNDGFPDWNLLKLQTAPSPEGPWSAEVLVYDANARSCGADYRPYGFLHAAALAMDGGRTLFPTYARPGPALGTSTTCPGDMRMVTLRLR